MGIDPGDYTGVAAVSVVGGTPTLIGKGTFPTALVNNTHRIAYRYLEQIYHHNLGWYCTVILEEPARRKAGSDKVWPLYVEFKRLFGAWSEVNPKGCRLVTIGPGLWKPIAKARKWKAPKGLTRHEKDALFMVNYMRMREAKPKPPSILEKELEQMAAALYKEVTNARNKKA